MDAGFTKCEKCGQPIYEKDLLARFNVCPHCEFHYPLPAPERIRLLTDAGSFEENDQGMTAQQTKTLIHWLEAGAPRGTGEDVLKTHAGEISFNAAGIVVAFCLIELGSPRPT